MHYCTVADSALNSIAVAAMCSSCSLIVVLTGGSAALAVVVDVHAAGVDVNAQQVLCHRERDQQS